MIKFNILCTIIIIGLSGCTDKELIDLRDNLIGEYSGIKISTLWNDTILDSDTTNITLTVSKTMKTSIIKLTFQPNDVSHAFEINDGNLKSTEDYHPPTLRNSNDSLFYHHQPGLGPAWVDCIVKKQ